MVELYFISGCKLIAWGCIARSSVPQDNDPGKADSKQARAVNQKQTETLKKGELCVYPCVSVYYRVEHCGAD